MDSFNLCNSIRMELEGIDKTKIPLDALPERVQEMVLALAHHEDYSVEYTMSSLLVAASTAIGNAVQVRIKGGWVNSPILYIILVGRPGMGKTPPLDFAFHPIRRNDAQKIRKFKLDLEQYERELEMRKGNKETSTMDMPTKPVLQRTVISDFTPEALMRAMYDNPRGIVVYVDEIMGMFNAVNQYNKGQLIEQLLTAFSGKPLDISRCSLPFPIHIEMPFINIVGTTQTTRVHELVDKGYKDNGLLDRILFSYPSDHDIADWQVDESDSSELFLIQEAIWERIIDKLISLPLVCDDKDGTIIPTIIPLSGDAKQLFVSWRNSNTQAANKITEDAMVDSRVMKTPMITARLALVVQLLRWACGEVDKENVDIISMKAAICLSEYFENCYRRIQKFMMLESVEPQKKDMLDLLPPVFTTAQAIEAGKESGLSERTVMNTLSALKSKRIIKKLKRGEYEKLQ